VFTENNSLKSGRIHFVLDIKTEGLRLDSFHWAFQCVFWRSFSSVNCPIRDCYHNKIIRYSNNNGIRRNFFSTISTYIIPVWNSLPHALVNPLTPTAVAFETTTLNSNRLVYFFCTLFSLSGGGPPPSPPPRAPAGGLRPQWQLLGKFLRKKNFLTKNFFGGVPLPSPTWGPFGAP
jgi:hypothetical protein